MKFLSASLYAAGAVALALSAASPAAAITMKECSAKYKEAQTAKTLNGMKWQDFRKAQCAGADDAAAKPAATTTAATPAAAPAATPAPAPAAPKTAAAPAAPAAAPVATGPIVFPKGVDAKYAKESVGKGRMKTCVDQYNANKATNANGGLKWIQKGGGYWSECDKKLKA